MTTCQTKPLGRTPGIFNACTVKAGRNDFRWDFATPFAQDGWLYALDGHIIARMPLERIAETALKPRWTASWRHVPRIKGTIRELDNDKDSEWVDIPAEISDDEFMALGNHKDEVATHYLRTLVRHGITRLRMPTHNRPDRTAYFANEAKGWDGALCLARRKDPESLA